MSVEGPTDQTGSPNGPTHDKPTLELVVSVKEANPYGYKPRAQILQEAEWNIAQGHQRLYFQFMCEHCKAKNTFGEANMLYETGVCSNCGQETEVKQAGFMTVYEMHKPNKKGKKR